MATTVTTLATPGTTNWVCPVGVYSVQVELWGGGGTGGPATGTASGAGGGAGGQYVIAQVPVTPGTTYAVSVAAAASSATSAVVNGNDTTFASTTVVAKGGAGGANATGTTGAGGAGSTTGGVGDTVFAGGSGGNGVSSTVSGGGGGGAGSTGTGNSGSGQTAGTAKTSNGGAGGTGVSSANTRNGGSNYGGGGSGGLSSSATDRAGGNGAQGLAVLTYTTPKTNRLTADFASLDTTNLIFHNAATVSAGQFNCPNNFSAVAQSPNDYVISAAAGFDLTDSWASVKVISLPTASNGTEAGIRVVSNANTANWMEMIWFIDGNLYFREVIGSIDQTSLAYNSTTHAYWRLRSNGSTLNWDTSPDGVNWTNRRTKTAGAWDFTSVSIMVYASYYSTSSGQLGTLVADNLSINPPVTDKLVAARQAVKRASLW